MPIFYVRIMRCMSEMYWYANLIGHIYPVHVDESSGREQYKVAGCPAWIEIMDAELTAIKEM